MKTISPKNVIDTLKQRILVDGFHVVVDLEKSQGSHIVDAATGRTYLDCYSQFASQALGWNHPSLVKGMSRFGKTIIHKIANSDMYTEEYAEFVEMFASVTTDFSHYFFVDGGALAVENALKAAFDWKARKLGFNLDSSIADLDVIHLTSAFHGRTGYTMSLTNTGSLKTGLFPKFNWTRLTNPSVDEAASLQQAEKACQKGNVAAIIVEPIMGEGGDIHLSSKFLLGLRDLANAHEAMLIFDEVQTGLGLTGKWWAHQHFNIVPDMMCFGKKTQVCGFCSTNRIDEVADNVFTTSGRINSTWGGNLVDMVRSTIIIDTIKDNNLCENAAVVGDYFKSELMAIEGLQNVRGMGLMLAFDLPSGEIRDEMLNLLAEQGLLALRCGDKGIRFRPHLTFSKADVHEAIQAIKNVKQKKSWLNKIFEKKKG